MNKKDLALNDLCYIFIYTNMAMCKMGEIDIECSLL